VDHVREAQLLSGHDFHITFEFRFRLWFVCLPCVIAHRKSHFHCQFWTINDACSSAGLFAFWPAQQCGLTDKRHLLFRGRNNYAKLKLHLALKLLCSFYHASFKCISLYTMSLSGKIQKLLHLINHIHKFTHTHTHTCTATVIEKLPLQYACTKIFSISSPLRPKHVADHQMFSISNVRERTSKNLREKERSFRMRELD